MNMTICQKAETATIQSYIYCKRWFCSLFQPCDCFLFFDVKDHHEEGIEKNKKIGK